MHDSKSVPSIIGKAVGWFFAFANIFANRESGSNLALLTASSTAATVLIASGFTKDHKLLSRINARGLAVNGVVALASGGAHAVPLVATAVNFLFGEGNRLNGRKNNTEILTDPTIQGIRRVRNNPASWFGVAYIGTAILASHVLSGHINGWAVAAGCVDATMTIFTVYGLHKNKFKNTSSPFMAITVGSVFGVVAGFVSGNWIGVANKLCSGAGELLLALEQCVDAAQKPVGAVVSQAEVKSGRESRADRFYKVASDLLACPVKGACRLMQQRGWISTPVPVVC